MKPAPVPPLIVSQPEFLLQFFVVALDAPAQLSGRHEPAKADRFWQVRQPVLCRLLLCFRPPTPGLLAGDGHIPLACTPDASSAAPISGLLEPCNTEFRHEMTVQRIYESPRVTKP